MACSRHLRIAFTASALFCSAALLAGCGSSGPRFTGTVTCDGQAVDGGSLTLIPIGEESSEGKRSNVPVEIKDGNFSVGAEKGLKTGKYRVEVFWFQKTGKQIESKDDPGHKNEETRQIVSKKFNADSTLTVEIKTGSNTATYAVTSK